MPSSRKDSLISRVVAGMVMRAVAWIPSFHRTRCLDESLREVLTDGRHYADPASDHALMPLRVSRCNASSDSVLHTAETRFRRRLERDPARLEAWMSAHSRRFDLESGTDVVSHFESVTGHAVKDFDAAQSEHAPIPTRSRKRVLERDRAPLQRSRAGSAVLASVLAVCLLTVGSYESDPLRALSGSAASSESILFGSLGERTRGHSEEMLELRRAEVLLALERITEARTSILGFHTGYDPTPLQAAATHLERATTMGSPGEPVPAALEELHREVRRMLE